MIGCDISAACSEAQPSIPCLPLRKHTVYTSVWGILTLLDHFFYRAAQWTTTFCTFSLFIYLPGQEISGRPCLQNILRDHQDVMAYHSTIVYQYCNVEIVLRILHFTWVSFIATLSKQINAFTCFLCKNIGWILSKRPVEIMWYFVLFKLFYWLTVQSKNYLVPALMV